MKMLLAGGAAGSLGTLGTSVFVGLSIKLLLIGALGTALFWGLAYRIRIRRIKMAPIHE